MKPGACGVAVLVLLAAAIPARADEATPSASEPPQPSKTVRDPEFGVSARHFGLQRLVQMYQWRSTGAGYARVWSAQALDSSGFAPGHENPPLPLHDRHWIAAVSVDGRPLDPAVVAQLGQWRDFRPSFNALPGNLAVTFQPEGDGLGSAENPLDPQVGDLRIRWRELVLPPLDDRIELAGGRWQLRPTPAPQAQPERAPAVAADAPATSPHRRMPWWLGGGATVVLLAAIAGARRRRRRQLQSR